MVALLPMKDNSERVIGKNFKKLNEIPLFFYIADSLEKTGLFSTLAINTDSEKISELAKKRFGSWVEIIERPKKLCGDFVSMNDIISHDVRYFKNEVDFLQTHSTNPFLKKETIIDAYKTYISSIKNGKYNCVFSVNSINTRLYDKNLKPINHNSEVLVRTQDLDEIFEENSNFYFFSRSSFLDNNHRIGSNPKPYIMDKNSIETLDIDNLSDWLKAEAFFN
jgi:CMP-N-acetylneuraminic acid synthetase